MSTDRVIAAPPDVLRVVDGAVLEKLFGKPPADPYDHGEGPPSEPD